jgi:hypothetical protein
MLRRLSACLNAVLSAKNLVARDTACWGDAKWDAVIAVLGSFATQLWQILPARGGTGESQMFTAPTLLNSPLLGSWETRRFDLHSSWCDRPSG